VCNVFGTQGGRAWPAGVGNLRSLKFEGRLPTTWRLGRRWRLGKTTKTTSRLATGIVTHPPPLRAGGDHRSHLGKRVQLQIDTGLGRGFPDPAALYLQRRYQTALSDRYTTQVSPAIVFPFTLPTHLAVRVCEEDPFRDLLEKLGRLFRINNARYGAVGRSDLPSMAISDHNHERDGLGEIAYGTRDWNECVNRCT